MNEETLKNDRLNFGRGDRRVIVIGIVAAAAVLGAGVYVLAVPGYLSPPRCESEGSFVHVHPYLRIIVNRHEVYIPGGVGRCNGGAGVRPLHTEDDSGIIHLTSNGNENFSLGQFFATWKDTFGNVSVGGVARPIEFGPGDILGYKTDAEHVVVLFVDGMESNAWGNLDLNSLDYCSASSVGPPCRPTAQRNLVWKGGAEDYPFGTGHTIVIAYCRTTCYTIPP